LSSTPSRLIGKRPIDQVTTPEIVAALSPIWFEKHETARRLKQRIATVFDDAKGKGHIAGENPVAGVSASLKSNKRTRKVKHHAAMDYRDLPAFMARLRGDEVPAMSRLASRVYNPERRPNRRSHLCALERDRH
jgi:hypothetical protein